jgi:glycerol-3-phosphate dehydrogenase (NAD(P)+)
MVAGLIGLGNLGTAIGNLVAGNGHAVIGWEHNPQVVDEINQTHSNTRFLPGVSLDPKLKATHSLLEVIDECPVIFIALPSVFIESTLGKVKEQMNPQAILVNMAKGIDRTSGLTSFQVLICMFPKNSGIMLSGPSIASEFALGLPTVVVLAGQNRNDLLTVSHLLDNTSFRTRFSEDAIGVELGGVLKNIYAIGLGMFDGQGIRSVNFRAAYLTIALEEMARIGVGLGAKIETFLYLSGMGDLLATSMSEHSHNRRMGELLAQGLTLQQIRNEMGIVPEGYNTLKSMLYLAEKLHIAMPLAKGLWDVAHGRISPQSFINSFIRDFVD